MDTSRAVVFENVKRLIPRSAPVWINGATSTIGTALIIAMAQYGYESITFHSGSEKRASKLLETAKARYEIPDGVIQFCADDAEFVKFKYCILGSSFSLPLDKVSSRRERTQTLKARSERTLRVRSERTIPRRALAEEGAKEEDL